MVQVADAVAQLVSPLLAGVLLGSIGLRGIIILDGITFIAYQYPRLRQLEKELPDVI